MKNRIFQIVLIFMSILFLKSGLLFSESIKNYDVEITINKNATLSVKEKILYGFDVGKHGIYRDIPTRSKERGFDFFKSFIKMKSIKRNGKDEEYQKDNFYEGIRYKVGSAERYVFDENTYEFDYDIYNAVFEKNGIYQIYFNAIGQFWSVPIEKGTVTIKFYDGKVIEKSEIQDFQVFTGGYGDKDDNYKIDESDGKIKISTNGKFEAFSGLTFKLNLKTDKISPTQLDKLKVIFYTNPILILAPILFIILMIYGYITWYFFGKDPENRSIIPEFTPPKDMSAMFVAYLKGVRDPKEILNIGVLSLISKGIVSVKDESGNGRDVRYKVQKHPLKKGLFEEEIQLLEVLDPKRDGLYKEDIFSDGEGLYKVSNKILKTFEKKYSKQIYKKNNIFLILPVTFFLFLILMSLGDGIALIQESSFSLVLAIIVIFVLIVFPRISFEYLVEIKTLIGKIAIIASIIAVFIVCLIISEIITFAILLTFLVAIIIYKKLIGKYTISGIRQMEYINGMKMYIKTAEENQIKKFNDVDELVNYFKLILPFAVALGVKNEAIRLMEKTIKLYNFEDQFYYITRGSNISVYNNLYLHRTISRSYNDAQEAIMAKTFSTRSGGSSGFGGGGFFSGGGGFSGGGSGGGGGGSW